MKRHLITIIIVLAAVCGIWAQETFTLRGKVYDFKTRTELPGATVQLMRTDSTVVTTTTAIEHWLKRRRIIRRLTGPRYSSLINGPFVKDEDLTDEDISEIMDLIHKGNPPKYEIKRKEESSKVLGQSMRQSRASKED